MNIEEGGRRLNVVISWVAGICIFFACVMAERNAEIPLFTISAIIGTFAGLICNRIGHWILNGFIGDQENKD